MCIKLGMEFKRIIVRFYREVNSLLIKVVDGSKLGDVSDFKGRKEMKVWDLYWVVRNFSTKLMIGK